MYKLSIPSVFTTLNVSIFSFQMEEEERELMKKSIMQQTPISKNNSVSSVSSEPSPTISEKMRRSWPLVKFTFRI